MFCVVSWAMVSASASRTIVLYEDDLDGTEAAGTSDLRPRGRPVRNRSVQKNADKLRKAMAPYVEAGRRVGGSRGRLSSGRSTGEVDPKAVRAWAESNGITVSGRGRVPADLVEQYRAAGN
jgi:Lsr2